MSKNKKSKVQNLSTFPKQDYSKNLNIKLGTKDLLDPSYLAAAKKQNPEVAKLVKLLKELRNDSSLWKAGKKGGQDQYAGLPPAIRLIDEALEGYE